MEKINLVKILKDCPTGMGLDCTVYDNCTLEKVFGDGFLYPIQIQTPEGLMNLTKYGGLYKNTHSKCVIFPKGKTTWKGFVPPCKFKDGDIISNSLGTCIFKGEGRIKGTVNYYCGISNDYFRVKDDKRKPSGHYGDIVDYRLATEEEKQKLFDAIKANGYKWNTETKTLEKLNVPIFKVGDKIRYKGGNRVKRRIVKINNREEFYYTDDGGRVYFMHQDDWEFVPDKFDITTLKPFDKVLVRNHEKDEWQPNFFNKYYKEIKQFKLIGICIPSYCNVEHHVDYCIPYEENKHLLGTTNDCDEFYKTWE